jgi:D-aspartate ligase
MHSSLASAIPALLTKAHYACVLAAARCLAAYGVSVIVAADHLLAPTLWSRTVARRLPCPALDSGPTKLLHWLLRFGGREPGAVLYPTSDDVAWTIARNRDELGRVFRLYSPAVSTLTSILDKAKLYPCCAAAGIDTPRTWFPRDEGELERIGGEAEAFIVKPRTQTFFALHAKGGLAQNLDQLRVLFREYSALEYAPEFASEVPGLERPIVQEYLPCAAHGVYSVSGFVDRSGRLLTARGSVKVLQQPSEVGIGLCFESFDPPPEMTERLRRLCVELGYFGVFEAELIPNGERWQLIDFNPRYFGQMGFDIARGSPLPWLAHLAAADDEAGALRAVQDAPPQNGTRAYRDVVGLYTKFLTGRAAGSMERDDARHWRAWLRKHDGHAVDAAFAASDPLPMVASLASTMWRRVRHPRSTWRELRRKPS